MSKPRRIWKQTTSLPNGGKMMAFYTSRKKAEETIEKPHKMKLATYGLSSAGCGVWVEPEWLF